MSEDLKRIAMNAFTEALATSKPERNVIDNIELHEAKLHICRKIYDLSTINKVYAVIIGKAGYYLARGLDAALGKEVEKALVLAHEFFGDLPANYMTYKCTHPLPSDANVVASEDVLSLAASLTESDLLLVLVSGGGSSVMTLPADGLSLADLANTSDFLMKAGASIGELNIVRKHLSALKGGRLALATKARVVGLYLSDVPGDELAAIASGPTVCDPSTYENALAIIKGYDLEKKVSGDVISHLSSGAAGTIPESMKVAPERVSNFLIGKNQDLLKAMASYLVDKGFDVEIDSKHFHGFAKNYGDSLSATCKQLKARAEKTSKPQAYLAGGETTVDVKGSGLGGRNTEVALAAAIAMRGMADCTILAAGSDGKDGPTDAAGAVVDGTSVGDEQIAIQYLENNDSYNFHKQNDDLIITGATGTNLMDVAIVLCK